MSGPHNVQDGEAGDPALPGNLLTQNTQNILERKLPSQVKGSRFQSKKFRYCFKSSLGQRSVLFYLRWVLLEASEEENMTPQDCLRQSPSRCWRAQSIILRPPGSPSSSRAKRWKGDMGWQCTPAPLNRGPTWHRELTLGFRLQGHLWGPEETPVPAARNPSASREYDASTSCRPAWSDDQP